MVDWLREQKREQGSRTPKEGGRGGTGAMMCKNKWPAWEGGPYNNLEVV